MISAECFDFGEAGVSSWSATSSGLRCKLTTFDIVRSRDLAVLMRKNARDCRDWDALKLPQA